MKCDHNVQEYEMRNFQKVLTFHKEKGLCIIKKKYPRMIPSNLFYVPPSVEFLGRTAPQFSKQIDASVAFNHTYVYSILLNSIYPHIESVVLISISSHQPKCNTQDPLSTLPHL